MKKAVVAMGCWMVVLAGMWSGAVAGDYKLPDTGQTKCYDNVGEIPCPQPGEPFYGQDGCYTINPPSYTKLNTQGNDLPDSVTEWVMVRDNVTGLIWEVKTDDHESIRYMYDRYTWQNAQDVFIAELNSQQFGGYSDWRMPTIKELTTIIDHGKYDPAINTDYFPNTMSPAYWYPGYWSSTTFANKSDGAWGVSFYSAHVGPYQKSHYKYSDNYVRAVCGSTGAAQGSLVDNGDETITDTATGLMWQKETADFKMNWEEALGYCENLTLARYNDWRLPNERELGSLVDYDKYEPSIDTIVFPDTVSCYYWSSTTYSLDRRQACDISFESGLSNRFDKFYKYSDGYYVRAVRGGQASSFNNLTFPLSGTLADRTVNLAFGADWPEGECDGLVKKHAGVDISAVKGESVYAANPGIVRAIVDGGTQRAKAVTIEHITSDPVFTTVYWHIDPAVTLGQTVINGQIIGNIADLGANTHLHFGVRMSAYSNISNRGALPQTDCGGDPAFPEHFVDPLGLDYAYVWTLPGHQLEYGDLPAQTPTAKNLVFITHGWNSDKYVWATDMANSVNGAIKDRINSDEWYVWPYDWSADANTIFPQEAYVNANAQGVVVGQILAALNYDHIHFIAHSAGSALIDTATNWIKAIDKDSPPTIHCSFLDAYDPGGALSTYGANATWAEQYVDTRSVIFLGLAEEFDTTDTYLKNCFNFDVTELDEEGMDADYLSRHAWPRVFYQETIDDSFSCGFSLSLESGISVSDFMLNKQVYPPGGNCICPICDISVPDISTHYIWEYNNPLDFYAAQYRNEIIISNTGTVTIDPSIPSHVTLTQGSPVWMSMQFEVIEPINILSLDYEFLSSSDGLLSVFFDNEVVSKIDERVAFEGTNEASSIWLGEVEPSMHVLSFRLDSFTGGQSVVKITNVRTGIMKVISTEDATIQTLQDLLSTINNLDDGVFKNKNTVKTLTNKINAILKQVDGGLYQGALGKMVGDILSKTNGCAEGGVPDKNDWIVDCEAQNQVYPLVIKVIELLGSLS